MALKAFCGPVLRGDGDAFFTSATPGIEDYARSRSSPTAASGRPRCQSRASSTASATDIRHPRTDEFNVSFEKQLTRTLRLTATGIWRRHGRLHQQRHRKARWRAGHADQRADRQPFTGYNWANRSSSNDSFFIRNTEGFQYLATDGSVIATADPRRSYKGLMLLLNSSLRKRFGYQLSYVLSKATGNVDNTGFGNWLAGTTWDSPNTAIINAYGELTNSRRHEIKAYVSVPGPQNRRHARRGVLRATADVRTRRTLQYTARQLQPADATPAQIFLEPRGTERNDFYNKFDLRAEKAFEVSGHRFGVFADIFNLFNTATVTTRQARYPSTTISGRHGAYKAPTAVQAARQLTFGGRWLF